MREWLISRESAFVDVDEFILSERFVYESGEPVRVDDRYRPQAFIWFYRDLEDEAPVPGKVRVVYRDERIVVVDKPPFLSSIPRGKHVRESVVVRMRHELGLPELSPLHRLDRVTSGLIIMATEQQWRGPYQLMFQRGEVEKTYRAVAPIRPELELPTTVRSHLTKTRGVFQAEVIEGAEPNSESLVELESELPAESIARLPGESLAMLGAEFFAADPARSLGVYRLSPRTGKTHQLRMHLLSLGIPIVGDPLYPVAVDVAIDDFTTPLQLLASELRFIDPIDGTARYFASGRTFPLMGND